MSGFGAPEIVATGLRFPEGPVPMPDGSVLLVEIARGTLTRVSTDGSLSVVAELGGGPYGLAIGPDGAAYVCNNGGFQWVEAGPLLFPGHAANAAACGSIQRVDLATGAVTTLYDGFEGEALKGPNDIVFDGHGGFWFTDHGQVRASGRDHGAIYYAKADGSHITRQRAEVMGPNGIGLSPDDRTLYVSETMTARVWAMDVVAPGELAPPPPWAPGRLSARRRPFACSTAWRSRKAGASASARWSRAGSPSSIPTAARPISCRCPTSASPTSPLAVLIGATPISPRRRRERSIACAGPDPGCRCINRQFT
jgi:gluconolactonase